MVLKVVLIIALCYGLFRLFMNDRRKNDEKDQQNTEKLIADGQLVKDPACGTYVDPETAISVKDGDTKHYFCSYECRDKFINQIESK